VNPFSTPLGLVLKRPRSTTSPSSLSVQQSPNRQGKCRSSSQSWPVYADGSHQGFGELDGGLLLDVREASPMPRSPGPDATLQRLSKD
jgi:hypothetical protein